MNKRIQSALISVFYKDGLENIVKLLSELGITIYSTGGTQQFIEKLGIAVVPVENLTSYPSILGGRVKTLHPSVFGGILGKRDDETHVQEMKQYNIPEIDLVIVDLYPFEETVASTTEEKLIIEKIDIGGPSMIRGAAKNFKDVVVVAAKKDYAALENLLKQQKGETTIEQRKSFAAKAFEVVAHYDVAIAKYFNSSESLYFLESVTNPKAMRYGENPHQSGVFYGDLEKLFDQLNGVEVAIVTTASPMSPELEAKVMAKIKEFSDKNITIENIVDESIIGGFILRIGDMQFNASITNRLQVLKRELSN